MDKDFTIYNLAGSYLYSLWLAFDVMFVGIASAVTVNGTLRIELFITLTIGCETAVAPNGLALQCQRGAIALEAVA